MEKFIDDNLMKIKEQMEEVKSSYDKIPIVEERDKLKIRQVRLEGKFEAYMEMLSELKQCKL